MQSQGQTVMRFVPLSGSSRSHVSFLSRRFVGCQSHVGSDNTPPNGKTSEDLNEKARKLVEQNPKVKEAIQRITDASLKYEEALQKRQVLEDRFAKASEEESDQEMAEEALLAKAEKEAAAKRLRAAELRRMDAQERKEEVMQIISMNADRLESIKSAALSSVGAIAVFLPLVLISSDTFQQKIIALGVATVSGALYGITYRYAIGNGKNIQQKIGVLGAFAIVSGLSYGEAAVKSDGFLDTQHFSEIAIFSAQSFLLYLACTAVIEFALQSEFLKLPPNGGNRDI